MTREQLLARVDALCARQAAVSTPLVREIDRTRGFPHSSAVARDKVEAAARAAELGLRELRPASRDSEAFRRYRRAVARANLSAERITAGQRTGTQPTQDQIDNDDDAHILERAAAAILGARRCTYRFT